MHRKFYDIKKISDMALQKQLGIVSMIDTKSYTYWRNTCERNENRKSQRE